MACVIEVLQNSCNTGTRSLLDTSTLSPWACGPRASGVHIRQITCAHVTTIKCDTRKSKPNGCYLVDNNEIMPFLQLIHQDTQ